MMNGFATDLNVYRVMAHHPSLLLAWEQLRNHVVKANSLPNRELEIVILRTGFRLNASYEWAHHVVRGRTAGLSDHEIAQCRLEPSQVFDARQALLVKAVDCSPSAPMAQI